MAKDKKKRKPKKTCCEKPARKMCKRCPRRLLAGTGGSSLSR